MTERVRSASTTSAYNRCPKMDNDLSPRKTMIVLVIVVGCFAVLWPKVFYPMLVGSANQHIKPSSIDKTTGCCDVISETDVNTIKIMSELCGTIIQTKEDKPLSGKEIVQRCRQEVLETCGIDISVVLQEQVRLGQSVKQILDEIRSLNGSLCLKYNYGVAPWRLGVPHRITVKMAPDVPYLRQERPHHLRSELVHPAFRERGRAIPQPQAAPPSRPPPRVVEGRPGPLPGMRPTIGGAGHVVPPSKQGTSSMSVIMPIYTIGIVIFFTYTLMRILFKKQPEGVGGALYPPVNPDPHFRKEVFESETSRLGPRYSRDIASKLVVNAMSALLDEVDQELEARRKTSEVASQDLVNGTLSNGDVVKPQETEEQPTVKVLGMEMTASCEGGKKWSRPDSPVLPTSPPPPAEPVPPPQEIFLEGALPPQSHLLVADSATEPQPISGEDPAVVLSGKMTLSVVSLDSDNGAEEADNKEPISPIELQSTVQETTVQETLHKLEEPVQNQEIIDFPEETMEEPDFEIEEYELHPLIVERFDAPPASKIQVEDLEKQNQESTQSATITEPIIEHTIQAPLIHLESEEMSHTVEVEEVEKEVDDLIQEAVESIEQGQPIVEIMKRLQLETNEINDNLQKQDEPTLQVLSQKPEQENLIELGSIQQQAEERIVDNEQVIKDSIVEHSENNQLLLRNNEEQSLKQIEEQLKLAAEEVADVPAKDVDIFPEEVQRSTNEDLKQEIESEVAKPVEISEENKKSEICGEKLEPVVVSEKVEHSSEEIQQSVNQGLKPEVESEIYKSVESSKESIEPEIKEEKSEAVIVTEKTECPKEVISDNLKSQIESEIGKSVEKSNESIEPEIKEEILEAVEVTKKIEPTEEVINKDLKSQVESEIDKSVEIREESKEPAVKEANLEIVEHEKIKLPPEEIQNNKNENLQPTVESEIDKSVTISEESKKPDIREQLEAVEISENIEKTKVNLQETSLASDEPAQISKENGQTKKIDIVEKTENKPKLVTEEKETIDIEKTIDKKEESKSEHEEIILTDDDELGSDEELVEEIEEIVYEEESEEEDEGSEEIERITNRTDSGPAQRINGERSEDLAEESKYTTVSGNTAAENDISDEELTDNEEVEDEEEIIEIEEEIEDDDYAADESNDVNHISGESDPEL